MKHNLRKKGHRQINSFREFGFSLVEVLAVVAVAGALAAVAIPNLSNAIERQIAKQGEETLFALLGAQKRYRLEHTGYASSLSSLDISFPQASSKFKVPTLTNVANNLAQIERQNGIYKLSIAENGVVTCGVLTSPANACDVLGY